MDRQTPGGGAPKLESLLLANLTECNQKAKAPKFFQGKRTTSIERNSLKQDTFENKKRPQWAVIWLQ